MQIPAIRTTQGRGLLCADIRQRLNVKGLGLLWGCLPARPESRQNSQARRFEVMFMISLSPSPIKRGHANALCLCLARVGMSLLLPAMVLSTPPLAQAQTSAKVWHIGVLMPERTGALEALVKGLRDLGYVEGVNLRLEHRRFSTREELSKSAKELAQIKPDVIVVGTGHATRVLKAATNTVPIVMATSGDAVAQGLVASLAQPGGNVTGFTVISPELAAKRLQLLKEAAPTARRVAVVGCQGDTVGEQQWSQVQEAARKMNLQPVSAMIDQQDFASAFEGALRQKVEAVLVLDCSALPAAEQVTSIIGKSGLPALYPFPRYTQAGGLMAYGPDNIDQYRRAAVFVDKILKGRKPADLPVEQPTRFEFVINMKTAKALGLKIPPVILLRADRLIE